MGNAFTLPRSTMRYRTERWKGDTYALLVLLVDGVQSVLDGDALHIPRGDLKAEREV